MTQLEQYSKLREEFLGKNDECQIKAPGVCSFSALVIHHTNGRENERLLDQNFWMASCPECNIWIEGPGTKWAYENGIKRHKHFKSMKKNLEWFIERIGIEIEASSPKAYNGKMKITDAEHAKHLCNVAQEFQGYTFRAVEPEEQNNN